ncbi:hypothetical protein EV127DRAFT_471246 [Xylaria flabelliformis]|nr:hypothetical protein EV127DRAFT_471246 [Xylaria flabelliformis]
MSLSPSVIAARGGGRRLFAPTATAFIPKAIEAKKEVLDSSFITQTIPNVHRYAGIVGLCTVPEDSASMNKLGWHIADFLAFRALLCGDNPPRAQSWLAMSDIPALVEADPEQYVHGKDRRVVGFTARPAEREDDIQVETSSESLKEKFILAVKQKLEIVMKMKYPLLIIICGITSLEQDIYFGTIEAESRFNLKDLRDELGDSINQVEATVVTPSLFSAGWQINPSFGRQPCTEVRGSRQEFLARQFGGLFAQDISKSFVGWKCPALDEAKVDPLVRTERFPGPVCPSDEVKGLISQLQIKIQSCLFGGLTTSQMNHSLSFNKENDEWERLIRRRERPLDYRALDWYERKWAKVPIAQSPKSIDKGYEFLGSAFGATRRSQLHHIKCLIKESYLAWPDHWASNFGEETKKDFERFINNEEPDDLDCHEVFNVLEHRARQSSLADAVVQYFGLPMPHNQRCRDWDHLKWKQELSDTDRSSLIKYFGPVLGCVPGPNLPPGVNQNNMSKLQRRLESGANYVRAALGIQFLTSKDSSKVVLDRIENFLQEVKVKQAELLASNPDIHILCCKWLKAIDMPVRELSDVAGAARVSQGVEAADDTTGILDYEDEYEIYQGDDEQSPDAAVNITDESAPGQQFSSAPFDLFIPAQQQEIAAPQHLRDASLQQSPFATAKTKESRAIAITRPREDESVELSREHVDLDLDVEANRIITALQTTGKREERKQLTAELLQLLQSNQTPGHFDAKETNCVVLNSGSDESAKEPIATSSSVETKNDWHNGVETHTAPTYIPHKPIEEPQDPDFALPPHKLAKRPGGAPQSPAKTQQATERKTPPHLRGRNGGRRN